MQTSTYKLADNVLFQKVLEETVILEPNTGEYFTLDAIGTFIIEKLQAGCTLAETLSALKHEYDTKDADPEADLSALLAQMQQKGLMQRTDEKTDEKVR